MHTNASDENYVCFPHVNDGSAMAHDERGKRIAYINKKCVHI